MGEEIPGKFVRNELSSPVKSLFKEVNVKLAHPVYPTPLYEITASLLIFFFLWSIRKRIHVPALLFCIYLLLNGIERFLIEFIRVNVKYHFLGIYATQAQIIAVGMMILGIAGIIYFPMRYRKLQATSL